jgi:succinoglycan biosynthesis transport protein ExoP
LTPQLPASDDLLSADLAAPEAAPADLHLSEYWAIIKRRRRLIALCVFVASAIGIVLAARTKPMYRATVVLDVEKDRAGLLDASANERFLFDAEYLSTQIELMRSREIAERVVRKLKLLENRQLNPGRSGLIAGTSAQEATTELAQGISGRVRVTPVYETNILKLSFEGSSPQLTADIANAVAEAYIEWSAEAKFSVVGLAAEFLQGQIDQLRKELDAKQQQLLAYGREKSIISADPSSNASLQNLESLNRDYASAVADRVAREARYHEVRTARPESIADTLSNGLVTGLRSELARLERDYAEKLNLYKPEWPAMQQLKTQIDTSREHLDSVIQETVTKARDSARSEYETAVRREASLKTVLVPQRSEVLTSNTNAVEYNNLRLEVDAKRQLLDNLLRQEAQTQMTSRLRGEHVSNARIVDRALPEWGPFKPSYKKNVLAGLFGGGGLGIGLALFLSYMDRSLRSVEDVARHVRLPALGVIPALSSVSAQSHGYVARIRRTPGSEPDAAPAAIELLPHSQPRSQVAEAYRGFRTALLLSRAGGLKSIVITSCVSGEGKTTTAANLAVVLGQLGQRVLLVDADLHRPRLHEIFRVSNRLGLVSILAEGVESARVIVKTDVPDVFIVPSGPACPNPSGLLASEAMAKFLELARLNFDYVVLDAPPVAPVADALLIGSQTDGVVICVQGGKTARQQVVRVRDSLLWSNVRILGVLINNLSGDDVRYGSGYAYDDDYYDVAREAIEGKRTIAAARKV